MVEFHQENLLDARNRNVCRHNVRAVAGGFFSGHFDHHVVALIQSISIFGMRTAVGVAPMRYHLSASVRTDIWDVKRGAGTSSRGPFGPRLGGLPLREPKWRCFRMDAGGARANAVPSQRGHLRPTLPPARSTSPKQESTPLVHRLSFCPRCPRSKAPWSSLLMDEYGGLAQEAGGLLTDACKHFDYVVRTVPTRVSMSSYVPACAAPRKALRQQDQLR